LPETEDVQYQPFLAAFEQRLLGGVSAQSVASGIPGYISEQHQADQLEISLATLRRWRRKGYGPKSVKIGRKDYYPETASADFAAELLAKAETAAEPRRRGRPHK
jgi:hypothetical protein